LQNLLVSDEKTNVLKTIFDLMDSDKDGLISPDQFELSSIPTDMLEHLEAILFEIHQSKSPTDFPTFVAVVNKYSLYDDLKTVSPISLASTND